MDFISVYKDMVKDTLTFRNYKRTTLLSAILSGIVVIPFSLVYAITMLVYGLLAIWHKMINAPTDYLLSFVKGEGKDVRHATQAVVYFIGFPLIFFLKAITCFIVFTMGILHFVASVVGYIATLGGMTFSPFILDPADRTDTDARDTYPTKPVNRFIIVGLVLLFLCFAFPHISTKAIELISNLVDLGDAYNVISNICAVLYIAILAGYVTFTALYTNLFFRKKVTQPSLEDNGTSEWGSAYSNVTPAENTEDALV